MPTREQVFEAINSERAYQEALKDAAGKITEHDISGYMIFMEDYLAEARRIAARDWSDDCNVNVLNKLRAVVALGVACLEIHGAPCRIMPDAATLEARIKPIT